MADIRTSKILDGSGDTLDSVLDNKVDTNLENVDNTTFADKVYDSNSIAMGIFRPSIGGNTTVNQTFSMYYIEDKISGVVPNALNITFSPEFPVGGVVSFAYVKQYQVVAKVALNFDKPYILPDDEEKPASESFDLELYTQINILNLGDKYQITDIVNLEGGSLGIKTAFDGVVDLNQQSIYPYDLISMGYADVGSTNTPDDTKGFYVETWKVKGFSRSIYQLAIEDSPARTKFYREYRITTWTEWQPVSGDGGNTDLSAVIEADKITINSSTQTTAGVELPLATTTDAGLMSSLNLKTVAGVSLIGQGDVPIESANSNYLQKFDLPTPENLSDLPENSSGWTPFAQGTVFTSENSSWTAPTNGVMLNYLISTGDSEYTGVQFVLLAKTDDTQPNFAMRKVSKVFGENEVWGDLTFGVEMFDEFNDTAGYNGETYLKSAIDSMVGNAQFVSGGGSNLIKGRIYRSSLGGSEATPAVFTLSGDWSFGDLTTVYNTSASNGFISLKLSGSAEALTLKQLDGTEIGTVLEAKPNTEINFIATSDANSVYVVQTGMTESNSAGLLFTEADDFDISDINNFPDGYSIGVAKAPSAFSGSIPYLVTTIKDGNNGYQFGYRANGTGTFTSFRSCDNGTFSSITDGYLFTQSEKTKLADVDPSFVELNTTLGRDDYSNFEPGMWVSTPAGNSWVYFNMAGYPGNTPEVLNVRQVAVNSVDFAAGALSRTRNVTIDRTDPQNPVVSATSWTNVWNFDNSYKSKLDGLPTGGELTTSLEGKQSSVVEASSDATIVCQPGGLYGLEASAVTLNIDNINDFTNGFPVFRVANLGTTACAVTAEKNSGAVGFYTLDQTTASGASMELGVNGVASLCVLPEGNIAVLSYSTDMPNLSQPTPPTPTDFVITEAEFNSMFPNRNAVFTYEALVESANKFGSAFLQGTDTEKLQELLVFLAQCSHETTGDGYASGTFINGLYFVSEGGLPSDEFMPAYGTNAAGTQSYQGRGGLQLSYDFNYQGANAGIPDNQFDIVNSPQLVGTTPSLAWDTAVWFWVTPQYNKPSCASVINGTWTPTANDIEKNRTGATFFNKFGVITNIINGGIEAGSWDTNTSQVIPLGNGQAQGNDSTTNTHNAQAINRQQYYQYFVSNFFSGRGLQEFVGDDYITNAAYNQANFNH